MTYNLWNISLYNLLSATIFQILFYLTAFSFLGSKKGWKRIIPFTAVLIIIESLVAAYLYLEGYFDSPFIGQILHDTGRTLISSGILYWCCLRDIKKAIIISGISSYIVQMTNIVAFIVYPTMFDLSVKTDLVIYGLIENVVAPLFLIILLRIMKKLEMPEKIAKFIQYRGNKKRVVLTALLLPGFELLLELFVVYSDQAVYSSISLSFAMLTGFLVLVNYVSDNEIKKEKMKIREAMLKQQEDYVRNLEEIQQEMRMFRHDYKNILSGLYLQVQEGKFQEAKDAIQNITGRFDKRIGEKIKQTTQVTNIQVMELKSLLLTKLIEMREKGIHCELEVLYPVERVMMNYEDLNRCMGILLDNAIEAAAGSADPRVDVLISKQEGSVTFIVGNRAENAVELSRIWTTGYSTKGPGRGMGLNSYKKILEKYPNILPAVSLKKGYFRQEIKIMEV